MCSPGRAWLSTPDSTGRGRSDRENKFDFALTHGGRTVVTAGLRDGLNSQFSGTGDHNLGVYPFSATVIVNFAFCS